ncbi:MAG: beta-glucosidase [Flavobacterium sp.]|jgi:beta-glucosidase
MLSDDALKNILENLTLADKVKLVSGESSWRTHAIEEANIPVLKVSDGPNGVRGDGGVSAACFPVGVCMASTWNVNLLGRIGKAIADEARSKSVQVVLGPTINIQRTPLGGRNFECFSEDAFLSGELASSYTLGLQAEGIGACLKHFVCNDSEFERHTLSVEVDDRTLREIYLRPFEIAIKKSQPWTIMAAYNRINGTYACSHDQLINRVLKDEWDFDGLVISDWYAAKETIENANGGLDLEMPGPAIAFGNSLLEAVNEGHVDESTIDDKVIRLLRLLSRSGNFAFPDLSAERAENQVDHQKVAYDAATEGMVLLKNEGLLPIKANEIKSLAVIGPNSEDFRIMGGGSSSLKPHYIRSPIEALAEALPEVKLQQHFGCQTYKYLPGPATHLLSSTIRINKSGDQGDDNVEGTQEGLQCYFLEDLNDESSINERIISSNKIFANNPFAPGTAAKALKIQGYYQAETEGEYEFGLLSTGQSRLYVDGEIIIDAWDADQRQAGDAFFQQANLEKRSKLFITKGRQVEIRIEFNHLEENSFRVLRYGILPPELGDPIEDAAKIAEQSDYVLLLCGTNDDWETEGNDREMLALPGKQDQLIERILKANKNTIVVNNSGSPISMPWVNEASAIIQAWFAGQEFGKALSDIILGISNPSGKLPISFPIRLEDTPAFTSYPGEFGKVHYGEGIFVGYKWYLSKDIPCLFPFGHGLSYTQFSYKLMLYQDQAIDVTISNCGQTTGKEVIQIYSHALNPSVSQPKQKLIGFKKVELTPGETKTVSIELDDMAFCYWHVGEQRWLLDQGTYRISAASSSTQIHLSEDVIIQ